MSRTSASPTSSTIDAPTPFHRSSNHDEAFAFDQPTAHPPAERRPAPPLRTPFMVAVPGQQRLLAKALPAMEAAWHQELKDARRAGRSTAYFMQRKKDVRQAQAQEGMDVTPLFRAYDRLIVTINTMLADMPHRMNKVEGKRLRQLCKAAGLPPEVLLQRPEVRAQLHEATLAESQRKRGPVRRMKGPAIKASPTDLWRI